MRTVSFSHARTRNLLNREFVCTYTNLDGDPTAGQSIGHQPNEPAGSCIRGNGKQNVQVIFMNPDGDIIHVSTGFLSPHDLVDEAKFALSLFEETRNRPPEDTVDLIEDSHRDRLAKKGFSDAEIESKNPMMLLMQNQFANRNGSQLRQPPRNGDFNPMESFEKKQILEDNQFSMRNPLMNWRDLERDPTKLVGNGKSFFSSSSSNSNGNR